MRVLLISLSVLAGFALASFLALYSYGRFLERAQGEPSFALKVARGDTPLDRLAAPLLEERRNQSGLMLIEGNLDAFAVRALSARQAGRSLDLQYYIWDGDLTGQLLADEVIKAADRGVRVRLLLDDINARGRDRIWLALDAHPNITVRLFNPSRNREGWLRRSLEMLLRAVSITRRMHNKAWIADGRFAVVGGRNVGDAYFDAASTSNFRDLDLLAMGAAVSQAESIFDEFWNSRAVLPVTAFGKPRPQDLPKLRKALAALAASDQARPYLERVAQDEDVQDTLSGRRPVHWTKIAEVVSDPPEKARGTGRESWLLNVVAPLLAAATKRLEIISPYFIPGEAGTAALVDLVRQGTEVAVLTNSLAATDVMAVHGAYARYRTRLVAGGVELFELKPYGRREGSSFFGSSGSSLHTKAFTVDGRSGFVGSMNFDPRSASLNTEMGILFESRELVAAVSEVFADETSGAKSYRIDLEEGAPVWRDEGTGGVRTLRIEPEASLWRRLVATAIGWLPIESQL